jgi:GNAT superfamily N-acetyltransferase
MTTSNVTVRRADYGAGEDADTIRHLLDGYARDPMGGGKPLGADVLARLVGGLAATPTAFTLLAFVDDKAVGMANALVGYSTFAARPLVNLHDLVVEASARGKGVGTALLSALEAEARAIGACKLTLEVLSGNVAAQSVYRAFGFEGYALDQATGSALFWQKPL